MMLRKVLRGGAQDLDAVARLADRDVATLAEQAANLARAVAVVDDQDGRVLADGALAALLGEKDFVIRLGHPVVASKVSLPLLHRVAAAVLATER